MKTISKYFGLLIVFGLVAYVLKDYFFSFSIEQLPTEKIQIISRTIQEHFYAQLIFVVSFASIPLLYYIVSLIIQPKYFTQIIFIHLFIIVFGIIIWQFRLWQLNEKLVVLSENNFTTISFSFLKLERYLLYGLLIGTAFISLFFVITKYIYKKPK